jgi:hypothetical protein
MTSSQKLKILYGVYQSSSLIDVKDLLPSVIEGKPYLRIIKILEDKYQETNSSAAATFIKSILNEEQSVERNRLFGTHLIQVADLKKIIPYYNFEIKLTGEYTKIKEKSWGIVKVRGSNYEVLREGERIGSFDLEVGKKTIDKKKIEKKKTRGNNLNRRDAVVRRPTINRPPSFKKLEFGEYQKAKGFKPLHTQDEDAKQKNKLSRKRSETPQFEGTIETIETIEAKRRAYRSNTRLASKNLEVNNKIRSEALNELSNKESVN